MERNAALVMALNNLLDANQYSFAVRENLLTRNKSLPHTPGLTSTGSLVQI